MYEKYYNINIKNNKESEMKKLFKVILTCIFLLSYSKNVVSTTEKITGNEVNFFSNISININSKGK